MAKNQDEIEDDDLDTEDNIDDEDEDEEDEGDADGDDDSKDEDEDAEGSDDDDSSEDDEEAPLPKTRKQLDDAIAKGVRDALKRGKNRSAADRRTSKKGKLSDRERNGSAKNNERLEAIEANQVRLDRLEAKRQFGYETGLAPDEVNVVFKLTKKPSRKSLEDPIIKGALEGYRSNKRAKNNIPSGSGRPVKVNAREEKNMTPAEKRTRFEDRRREILAGKQR